MSARFCTTHHCLPLSNATASASVDEHASNWLSVRRKELITWESNTYTNEAMHGTLWAYTYYNTITLFSSSDLIIIKPLHRYWIISGKKRRYYIYFENLESINMNIPIQFKADFYYNFYYQYLKFIFLSYFEWKLRKIKPDDMIK